MTTVDPSVYDDPKISDTLAMLAQGKSRDEIASHFGNKSWSNVDMYFRRRGFRWNGKTYEPREEKTTAAAEDARYIQTKSAQVVRQLNQKYADIRQVAMKNGFSNVEALGEYMKSQGYVWNGEANNYEYDEKTVKNESLPAKKLSTAATMKIQGVVARSLDTNSKGQKLTRHWVCLLLCRPC